MHKLITVLLMTLLLPFSAIAASNQNNPAGIPDLLQAAIDARDSGPAMQHLQMDSIVKSVFEETLPQINESVAKGEIILNPVLAAALGSLNSGNAATQRMATIFLSDELGKFLAYGVDSGAFSGNPISENERMQMDGGVFSRLGDISMARKEFSDTRVLKQDENSALVKTSLYDHGVRQSYPLQLKMERLNGVWKVTSLTNAVDLYKQILRGQR